jgi:hypothetical protein
VNLCEATNDASEASGQQPAAVTVPQPQCRPSRSNRKKLVSPVVFSRGLRFLIAAKIAHSKDVYDD